MNFDYFTAFFLVGLLHVLIPILIWRLLVEQSTPATVWWCSGGVWIGAGALWLTLAENRVPHLMHGIVTAFLTFWGIQLKIRALRHFLSVPHSSQMWGGLAAAYLLIEVALDAQGGKALRGLYVLFSHILLYGYLAWLAWRLRMESGRRSVTWIFWSYGVVVLMLLGLPLGVATSGPEIWKSGLPATMLAIVGVLVAFTSHIGYMGLVLEDALIGQHAAKATSERLIAQNVLTRLFAVSERERVLADVSRKLMHEINQPLTSMGAIVSLMRRALRDRRWSELDVDELVHRLGQSLFLASGVINQLRPLAKFSSAKFETLELSAVVKDALSLLEVSGSKPVVRWQRETLVTATVEGNRVELIQLMVNLLRNALEACAVSGVAPDVTLCLRTDGTSVFLDLRDNGPGFSPQMLKKAGREIFTTKEEGMGIGLWICRDIVERHGGELTFRNHTGGAEAILRLPLKRETLT